MGVSAIDTTTVEVTFATLTEAKTDVTVEVKDADGNVVEVVAQDLAAGTTTVQFDFVKAVAQAKLTGVWTVNGKAFSFTVLEQIADINALAASGNQLALLTALTDAGVKNLDEAVIGDYTTDIKNASPQAASIADVQKIVDDANKAAAEGTDEATIVKAVQDAKTQVALYNVLKANFDRVNSTWSVDYASGVTASKAGIEITTAGTANNVFATTGGTAVSAPKAEDIQKAIDAVNAAAILADDTVAKTAAEQAKVTALIQSWVKADDVKTPLVTPKATAIEKSEINRLGFVVAEATTENSLYNALVAYANATPDATLKASELNPNLKADYLKVMNATSETVRKAAVVGFTGASTSATYDYKANVVGPAYTAALGNATAGALKTINDLTATNTAAEVKAALQKLADVTAHQAVGTKFDMSTVIDEKLLDYVTLTTNGFKNAAINDIGLVNTAITAVNATVEEASALKVIASADSTTAQVRDALVELALTATPNTTVTAFVNAPSQIKLEVAQFVADNRDELAQGAALTAATITANSNAGYNTAAIGTAVKDHAAKVAEFNAIGDLDDVATTTASTKAELDTYAYAPYKALSAAKKLAVAEEINKLTKSDGATPPVLTPLDFGGNDAVTTLKAANAIIDAAIKAVAE